MQAISSSTIEQVPDEVMLKIFGYINEGVCWELGLVCKRWNGLVNDTKNHTLPKIEKILGPVLAHSIYNVHLSQLQKKQITKRTLTVNERIFALLSYQNHLLTFRPSTLYYTPNLASWLNERASDYKADTVDHMAPLEFKRRQQFAEDLHLISLTNKIRGFYGEECAGLVTQNPPKEIRAIAEQMRSFMLECQPTTAKVLQLNGEAPNFSVERLPKLKQLFLNENNLYTFPSPISKLHALNVLYLGRNHLNYLPNELGQLENLTILDLSENDFSYIPLVVFTLKTLEQLSMKANYISSVPKDIKELSHLEVLDLSKNLLSRIPDEIGQCSSLTILNIEYNKLTHLPDTLINLTQLKTLAIGVNRFNHFPMQIEKLPELELLDLAHNQIEVLPKKIKFPANLKKIYIQENGLKNLSVLQKLKDAREDKIDIRI